MHPSEPFKHFHERMRVHESKSSRDLFYLPPEPLTISKKWFLKIKPGIRTLKRKKYRLACQSTHNYQIAL
ncbi:hypothetical protein Sjap_000319 [Stephania japonica]|uniref:Uncharacterized protein n=1 Tax=Stephania japonica TaxID=461633 RepID=A0AAP0KJM2_9MAGN